MEAWIAGHLYYHQSLDLVARRFVHPLVVSLLKAEEVDAFFFVRYSLGGPHIRLRLRASSGSEERVLKAMRQSAHGFLEIAPSTCSVSEEAIRRANRAILAADPNEVDSSVYPDNSFRVAPFCPEIERYGGLDRLRISLNMFSLSSVAALDFLSMYGDAKRTIQLAQGFRLLFQQALGFAVDRTELSDLVRYGVDSFGQVLPTAVEKGDKVARLQMHVFLQLFWNSLGVVAPPVGKPSPTASDILMMGSRRLSGTLGGADRATRLRIGGSHLHMTATRLGLSNAEEVYISRIMAVTLDEVLANYCEDLSWLDERTRSSAEFHGEALDDLLRPAFATLTRQTFDREVLWPSERTAADGASCQTVDQNLERPAIH
jgi:hypothetical protein